ncbi:hypothetical protein SDC9_195765 [bioreactor metagenome]|uniref:Uncharacterized protein n=1 Tax=bioreactor metagenome TaxID=1076179 RepID=A0A645IAL7_9ZZZZ
MRSGAGRSAPAAAGDPWHRTGSYPPAARLRVPGSLLGRGPALRNGTRHEPAWRWRPALGLLVSSSGESPCLKRYWLYTMCTSISRRRKTGWDGSPNACMRSTAWIYRSAGAKRWGLSVSPAVGKAHWRSCLWEC